MDASERALLATTFSDALSARAESPSSADAVLRELGWLDMLAAEPDAALAVVFDALGRTNATATALDDVMVAALGIDEIGPRPDLAILLPAFGQWQPPGRFDHGRVRAHGIATARAASTSELLVVGLDHADLVVATVPVAAATITRVHGVDPSAEMHVVDVDAPARATPITQRNWNQSVALGRRALSHQIAGACHAMLDLACTHAVDRVQFGRPIASFQAVRHRLADALVAVEALDAALDAAAAEPVPPTAALAKAIAGNSARTVAAQAQQVLAGIGFTTDHPFHRFLTRTIALDGLLGSADDLTLELGRWLLRTRTVPTLIEL